jgi:hypothetical protein
MFHSIIFGNITLFNLILYILKTPIKPRKKSISLFFHLYFCVYSSFVYKDNDLIECSFIYFIADSILNIYFNTFKTFNKFHHIFALTLLTFHSHLDKNIINYTGMHEFSTIILCLIDLNLINKNTFEKLFPISFIMCRIVIYNYYVYIYLQHNYINIPTIAALGLLNIMNIGIILKMRLIQKVFKLTMW